MEEILIRDERLTISPQVKQGGLIRARYHSWCEPRNGLVTGVFGDVIQALFLPKIRTSAQYFQVKAREIDEGKWEIRYSNDLDNVYYVELTYGKEDSDGEVDSPEVD